MTRTVLSVNVSTNFEDIFLSKNLNELRIKYQSNPGSKNDTLEH